MDIIIKDFSPEYLDDLAEMEKMCFPGDPWSRETFAETAANESFNILFAYDMQLSKIVGYSVIYCVVDQADLANIAVLPNCRGRKIGKALMDATIEKAREIGVCEVFLEVRESNSAAIGLYSSSGFVEIGKRRNYYANPKEDAVLMMKNIVKG